MGEVVIGVDAHRRSHTLVAVDEIGRKLGERVVGHDQVAEDRRQDPEAEEEGPHVERLLTDEILQELTPADLGLAGADGGRRFDGNGADAHSTPR